MSSPDLQFRDTVRPSDARRVREIVASSGNFNRDEIEIAVELVEARLQKGPASGYHFVFAEQQARTVGYACFGPIPATTESFDLYWIAVHQGFRNQGIGRALLQESERAIARLGGRRIYVETSSRPQYHPTRAFYQRCGYRLEAELMDFYAPGDGKCIYLKVL